MLYSSCVDNAVVLRFMSAYDELVAFSHFDSYAVAVMAVALCRTNCILPSS